MSAAFVLFSLIVVASWTYPKGVCQFLEELRGPFLVYEPPSRLDFSNNTGTSLRCSAEGIPMPQIEWIYADGTSVGNVPGLRKIFSNGTLVINPFPAEKFRQDIHATVYKCLAFNSAGVVSSRSIHIRTVVTQLYEIHVYDEFVIARNTAVFKCNIPSFVLDYVVVSSWIKDPGIQIDMSSDYSDKYKIMPTGELHIRHVTSADSSTSYRCRTVHRMTNEVRTSTSSGRLFVTEPPGSVPPQLYHTKLNVRVRQGDSVILPCVAQGYPVPTYNWYKKRDDGKRTPFPVLGKYRQDVDSLKVDSVQESDSGIYVCVVNNTVGSVRAETSVFVWEPLSAYIQPKHAIVNIGQSVRFHCIVSGFPLLSVVWLKDAKPIGQNHGLTVVQDVLQISAVKKDNRGMYQCLVTNDDESVQAAAELRLGDLMPEFHQMFSEKNVLPGGNISLKCSASGIPSPRITWKLDDMELTKSSVVSIGSSKDEHGDVVSYLNISSVTVSEGGEYSCSAHNRVGQITHSSRVNVYGFPFVRLMERKLAVAGRDLIIKCPYGGYPIESISWEKDGTRLPVDHRQVAFRNGTLLIRGVQRTQDAGKYRCIISTTEGRSASRDLEVMVLVPPTVVPFYFQEGQLHVGMRAQVFCAVSEGDLPLTMDWLKDGQPLSPSVDVVVRRIDDYTSSLVISALGSRHNGNYTCVAANSAASAKHSTMLSVTVPPKWIAVPSDREILSGGQAIVDCIVDGAPKPKITWMKAVENSPGDYDEVSYIDEYVKQLSNGSLVIKNAREMDSGTYSCHATNGVGPGLSKVITVTVRLPVHFNIKRHNETVRSGDMANLRCEPNGDVPMEVTWLFNGRKLYIDSKPRYSFEEITLNSGHPVFHIIITQIEKHDAGIYTCQVRNSYGEDESEMRLIVLEPPSPPDVITVLSHGSRSVTLSWRKPFDGNAAITRYIVHVTGITDFKRDKTLNVTVPGSETSTTISGLHPSMTYYIEVAAENDVGMSDLSKSVSITTSEEAPAGAPLNVITEIVGPNSIKVSWKPPPQELWNGIIRRYYVGYRIADRTTDSYTMKTYEIKESETNDIHRFSMLLDNLQLYTRYSVVVQALNSVGPGPKSDEILVLTSEGVPSRAPENLVCSPVSSQSLRITWDPLKPAYTNGILHGYKLLYSPMDEWYADNCNEFKVTSGHQSNLSGLSKFTNYSIQVLGYTKVGNGVKSDPIFCLTREDVPDAPADLKAMATSATSILVTWKRPIHPNGILVRYNVYMRRTEEPNKEDITKHAIPASQTHFEAHGLRSSSRYEFWITAVTTIGEGQSTRVVNQKTTGPEVPARIVSFGKEMIIPWKTNIELPCKAVGVPLPSTEWMFEGRSLVQNDWMRIAGNGSLFISSVNGDNTGSYMCKAINSFGRDDITYTLNVQVPPQSPTLEVTGVFLFSLDLRWVPGDDGGSHITKFFLYYKRDFSEWEEITVEPKRLNYTLENLECGTRYQLYMTALNKHGTSNPSDTITSKTKGSPPQAPLKHFFIRESATAITLLMGKWDSGGCPILYFVIQYRTKVQLEWRLVSNNVLVQPEFIIPDLSPGTLYLLQVTAHNNAGSTVAHYDVTTKVSAGGTTAPQPAHEEDDRFLLYYDVKIVVLVTSILLLLFTASVIVCLCCRRKRQISLERTVAIPRPVVQQNRTEFGNTPNAGSFTYLLVGSKKGLKRLNPPNNFRKDPNTEEVNPYATSQILNNQLNEMQTFGERTQVPLVYPTLKREIRDGTFPRARRENILNLDNTAQSDIMCDEEYTSPIDDGDSEVHEGLSCYPIYASFPRTTRSSGHLHVEHHVPDLLEHGPESSTSNDTSSERMSSGIKSPESLERRYISDHKRGYDTEETTFVFLYHRDSHASNLNNQEFLDKDFEKLGLTNYKPEQEVKQNCFNEASTILYRRTHDSPPEHHHRSYETNRPIDFTIAV